MKKIISTILLAIIVNVILAQDKKVSHYIFPSFTNGTIAFKTGEPLTKSLNYNLLTSEMVFIQDGKPLAMFDISKIDTVTIANRKFVPDQERFLEVLSVKNKLLYVAHTASYVPPAANAGMGGTSQTSGQTAVTNVRLITGIYDLNLPDYKVILRDEFFLKNNDVLQRINTLKGLETIFPGRADEIKKIIRANKINLEKTDDVVKLLNLL